MDNIYDAENIVNYDYMVKKLIEYDKQNIPTLILKYEDVMSGVIDPYYNMTNKELHKMCVDRGLLFD